MCQVISNAVAASDAYADADTDASKQTAAVPATGVNTIRTCRVHSKINPAAGSKCNLVFNCTG